MSPTNKKIRTIYDIAKKAGVSPTTVSFVLNNKGNINSQTRKRILDLIAESDYAPSKLARRLRKKKSNSIGVIIDHFHNRFFNDVFEGIENEADKSDYTFLVAETKEDFEKEKSDIQLLMQHGVDGLILFPCNQDPSYLLRIQSQHHIPIVLIGNYYYDQSLPSVVANNWNGGKVATQKLISLGRNPILHIAGPRSQSMCEHRCAAFIDTIQRELDVRDAQEYIFNVYDLSIGEGYNAMIEINKRFKPPLSIFVVNDTTALGVLKYCRMKGFRIPEDVALIGFSNIDLIDELDLGLTSVHIPGVRMGTEAARLLIACTEKLEVACPEEMINLPVELIERRSTLG